MASFAARHLRSALTHHPMTTKISISLTLAITGDIVAQRIEYNPLSNKPFELDTRRVVVFGGVGIWWTGIFNSLWFNMLNKHFPKNDLISNAKKIVLNQGFAGPCLYIPAVWFWNGKLYLNQTNDEIITKLHREWWPTTWKLWAIFAPSNVFMFTFVPVLWQVPYVSVITFGWNILLSLIYNTENNGSMQVTSDSDETRGETRDATKIGMTKSQLLVSRRLSSNGGGGGL